MKCFRAMDEDIIVVPNMQLIIADDSLSVSECDGSLDSAAETCSISSADTTPEPVTHKLSLINILEMSSMSNVISPADLEKEQEGIMSQALSATSNGMYERSSKAQQLENAIKKVSTILIGDQGRWRCTYGMHTAHIAMTLW